MLVSSFSNVCRAVFSIDFLGTMFACGDSGVKVATFFDKLSHYLALAVKVALVTTEAP